ncbi:hypothetical protein BDV12DRAFT_191810 [Aspergillus spectabilis]
MSSKLVSIVVIGVFYFNIAAPRFLVKPDALSPSRYLYSISDSFREYPEESVRFVQGRMSSIGPTNKSIAVVMSKDVVTKPDVTLRYNYLVIASGSTTPAPAGGGHTRRSGELQNADTVVIGGGGPLGVELAGELAEAAGPKMKKKVILVSRTGVLLAGAIESVSRTAEALLQGKNIEIVKSATVNKGAVIDADAYISTMSVFIPESQFIRQWLLNEQG